MSEQDQIELIESTGCCLLLPINLILGLANLQLNVHTILDADPQQKPGMTADEKLDNFKSRHPYLSGFSITHRSRNVPQKKHQTHIDRRV